MVSRLLFLIATVLFCVLALSAAPDGHLLHWGLAAVAAGLLLEGAPAGPAWTWRRGP